jgi:hypothetical protein
MEGGSREQRSSTGNRFPVLQGDSVEEVELKPYEAADSERIMEDNAQITVIESPLIWSLRTHRASCRESVGRACPIPTLVIIPVHYRVSLPRSY